MLSWWPWSGLAVARAVAVRPPPGQAASDVAIASVAREGPSPLQRVMATQPAWLPVGLLVLAALAFWGVLHVPVFVDEADNVLGACLLGEGKLPYVDVFFHHFPLTYYLLAAFGHGAACSVLAARILGTLSIVLAGAGFAWLTRSVTGAVAVLLVALMSPMYYLQMYLSESQIVVGLILSLGLLTDRTRRLNDPMTQALRFVALTMLVWSSPLGLLMAAVVVPLMLIGHGRPYPGVLAVCAAAGLAWPLLLLAQGSLGAFVAEAIQFNTQVYSKYVPDGLTNPVSLLWATFTFARHRFSFAVDWLYTRDPDASAQDYAAAFEFLVLVLLALVLIRAPRQRAFRLGVVLLVPLAASREGFHLSPFIALAVFACIYLVPLMQQGALVARILGAALAVIALRVYLFNLPVEWKSPDKLAESLEVESRILRSAPEGQPVLFLPIAPQGYLAHDRRPASFYANFLPWHAEVPGAEDRIIADIEANKPSVIVVDQETAVWDKYKIGTYAPRLMAHVYAAYHPVDNNNPRRGRIFVRNTP